MKTKSGAVQFALLFVCVSPYPKVSMTAIETENPNPLPIRKKWFGLFCFAIFAPNGAQRQGICPKRTPAGILSFFMCHGISSKCSLRSWSLSKAISVSDCLLFGNNMGIIYVGFSALRSTGSFFFSEYRYLQITDNSGSLCRCRAIISTFIPELEFTINISNAASWHANCSPLRVNHFFGVSDTVII